MNCPLLKADLDFKTIGDWPVVLCRDVQAEMPGMFLDADYLFKSGNRVLGYTRPGKLILCCGYACDGYSPVLRIRGRFRRLTPTPRCGMFPSIMHDFARQFMTVEGCPWSRMETDIWFYNSLVSGGTNRFIAGGYYTAVAGPIGSLYIRVCRKPDTTLSIDRIPYERSADALCHCSPLTDH